jgi:ribosome-binding ATPase YchF (GTP1/OBG family)
VRTLEFSDEEREVLRELWLLTSKPSFYVLNIKGGVDTNLLDEWKARLGKEVPNGEKDFMLAVDSKTESDMQGLGSGEKEELTAMVDDYAGVHDVVALAYRRLDLVTFYTGNEKMCNAWTVKSGATVKEAAGVIHSDLEENFVAAEVASVEDVVSEGGWHKVKEAGKIKSVGRDYVVEDGDYILILANR